MTRNDGFTMVELMFVIAIIGILAAIAIPQFATYRIRAFMSEGYTLASAVRQDVLEYRDATGIFPDDNAMAGLAGKDLIKGKYVDSVAVDQGTIHVVFNDSRGGLADKFITLIPVVSEENPTGPVIWKVEKKD